MNRREALQYTASLMGVSLLGAEAFLSGCSPTEHRIDFLSDEDIDLLDEIGETILPESDRSPGAKAAQIGAFMKAIVTDCYGEEDQNIFRAGISEIRGTSWEKYERDFQQLSPQERFELVSEFDSQARTHEDKVPTHFFTMIKQLTIWGYFSSEPGITQAMRYAPPPRRIRWVCGL